MRGNCNYTVFYIICVYTCIQTTSPSFVVHHLGNVWLHPDHLSVAFLQQNCCCHANSRIVYSALLASVPAICMTHNCHKEAIQNWAFGLHFINEPVPREIFHLCERDLAKLRWVVDDTSYYTPCPFPELLSSRHALSMLYPKGLPWQST